MTTQVTISLSFLMLADYLVASANRQLRTSEWKPMVTDLGWRQIRTIGTFQVPLDALWVQNNETGRQEIWDSPHFEFVRNYIQTGKLSENWIGYIRQQHSLSQEELAIRTRDFISLIENFDSSKPEALITIARNGRDLVVVDGFHRLAIQAARSNRRKELIGCRLTFRMDQI